MACLVNINGSARHLILNLALSNRGKNMGSLPHAEVSFGLKRVRRRNSVFWSHPAVSSDPAISVKSMDSQSNRAGGIRHVCVKVFVSPERARVSNTFGVWVKEAPRRGEWLSDLKMRLGKFRF